MPIDFQLNRFTGIIKRKHRADAEFLAAAQGQRGERRDQFARRRAVVEIGWEFAIQKNPTATVKTIAQMVDLDGGSGELAAVLYTPCQGVKACIDGARGSSSMIEIDRAQANYGTERSSQGKRGRFNGRSGFG